MTVIPARSVSSFAGTSLNTFSSGQPRLVFWVVRGLDDSPEVRGEDTVIPGTAGRVARSRVRDRHVIEIEGYVVGLGASDALQTDDFRDQMETLRALFDPTAAAGSLVVLLEDATRTATITARSVNMLTDYDGMTVIARVNVEMEAIGADWAIATP